MVRLTSDSATCSSFGSKFFFSLVFVVFFFFYFFCHLFWLFFFLFLCFLGLVCLRLHCS